MLDEMKRRVMGMLARALVKTISEGDIQLAKISVLDGENIDEVERVQNFGLNSWPMDGAQGLVAFVGGNREHGILLSVDDPQARPAIEKGESVFYNAFDTHVRLKKTGTIELSGKKLVIKNGANELTSLLVELLTALNNAKVNTALGPQAFLNLAEFAALKSKFESFKE